MRLLIWSCWLLIGGSLFAQEPAAPRGIGERLLALRGCTSCHAAPPEVLRRLDPPPAPDLRNVAARLTPSYLEAYLTAPAQVHPTGRMPDLLAGLGEEERTAAARSLSAYLLTRGEPLDLAPRPIDLAAVERGRELFHSVGCVACHRPQVEPWELEWSLADLADQAEAEMEGSAPDSMEEEEPEPPLYLPPGTLPHPDLVLEPQRLARATTVPALAAFLREPRAARPSGRMPDLGLSPEEAWEIAAYLLRDQSPLGQGRLPLEKGLVRELFQGLLSESDDWDALVAADRRVQSELNLEETPEDEFGLRWKGLIEIESEGEHRFRLVSDDGSHLWIDGREVIDDGGEHAPVTREGGIELEPGLHTIEVTFYEHHGGQLFELSWAPPGEPLGPIPPERFSHVELVYRPPAGEVSGDAGEGKRLFVEFGCAGCHQVGDGAVDGLGGLSATPLCDLDPRAEGTCLSGSEPRIHLASPEEREALIEVLGQCENWCSVGQASADEGAQLLRRLDDLHCLACHRRDGLGGPHPRVRPFFTGDENAELGDEGRLPPDLTRVGDKLRRAWLARVLEEGARARPYMRTRMPRFGPRHAQALLEAFLRQDRGGAEPEPPEPDAELLEVGHELVGTGGLGCVQCHTFDGRRSLGVQAVDLTTMTSRLRYGWFRELLADPAAVNMDTRMPSFWPEGESVSPLLGGDPAAQIEALWAFLSLGPAMSLPQGLSHSASAYELLPVERPLSIGVFFAGVGPRTLLVGFPERLHYAYDMARCRLAVLWRGHFFNARGTWQGRAGALEEPGSSDRLDLPPGPAIAQLADPGDPWPVEGLRPLGRRLDSEGAPILRYAAGAVRVEERPRPRLQPGGARLERRFELFAPRPEPDLYLRLFLWPGGGADWAPPVVTEEGALRYATLDPPLEIRPVEGATPLAVVGRDVALLVPIRFEASSPGAGGSQAAAYHARVVMEYSW